MQHNYKNPIFLLEVFSVGGERVQLALLAWHPKWYVAPITWGNPLVKKDDKARTGPTRDIQVDPRRRPIKQQITHLIVPTRCRELARLRWTNTDLATKSPRIPREGPVGWLAAVQLTIDTKTWCLHRSYQNVASARSTKRRESATGQVCGVFVCGRPSPYGWSDLRGAAAGRPRR